MTTDNTDLSGAFEEPAKASASFDLESSRLYGILDLGYTERADVQSKTTALLRGGVDLLQLRAKGVDPVEVMEIGRVIQPLCQQAGIPFIVNDHTEIAMQLKADGLHIGQDDGDFESTRKQIGPEMLLGRSTHSPEQARQALADGFDYIGFGPLFPTPTKQGRPGIGMDHVATIEQEVGSQIPVFCIGGIKRANLATIIRQGAKRVVIVSDLLSAPDVEQATREAKALL